MELTKANGRLVSIGGAEDREGDMRILNKFVELAGGKGAVTVIDGGAMRLTNAPDIEHGDNLALADVKVHVLPQGYKFNLHERCVVIPKAPKTVTAAAASNGRKGKSNGNGNKK